MKRARWDQHAEVPIIERQSLIPNRQEVPTRWQPGKNEKALKSLGEGAFGTVFIDEDPLTGLRRAVKKVEKKQIPQHIELLKQELSCMKELDHPNIVKMYEFFEDDKRYYLVQEICKGGELFDEIIARGKFTERDGALLIK